MNNNKPISVSFCPIMLQDSQLTSVLKIFSYLIQVINKRKSIILVVIILLAFLMNPVFSQESTIPSYPQLEEKAPSFTANSTKGRINFPDDYKGKWVILFSHPGDFTPVCTSEMIDFANRQNYFKKHNCELIGLSVDVIQRHLDWIKDMNSISYNNKDQNTVDFPIISDSSREIANKYGMIHKFSSTTRTVRGVFIIDPKGVIRVMMYYPRNIGRNLDELSRILEAAQVVDEYKVLIPANWNYGDNVLIPPSGDQSFDLSKFENKSNNYSCYKWYFCFKKLSDQDKRP